MNSKSRSPLIAVLGCTSTVGAELMRQLAGHDCSVRGILRQTPRSYPAPYQDRPARVSYVVVDHSSEEQLARACAGADALFLLIGSNPNQVPIETRAIRAARRADVRRIVKLSAPVIEAPAAVQVAGWHRAIEAELAGSGLEYCCLRPYAFMQNWLRSTATIARFGVIFGSAGTAPRNYVDCRDIATIAAELLLSDHAPEVQALTITGPESISYQEMAERISRLIRSPVRYTDLSPDEHYRMLVTRARLPDWLARHIVELDELALRIPEPASNTVAPLLGRQPRTMDEFLHQHRSAFLRTNIFTPVRRFFARGCSGIR
jgi:uncharacterized protein YbjT (DUF2867 family)